MDNLLLSLTSPKDTAGRRGFAPLGVSKCHAQTAQDRFGKEALAAIRKREKQLTTPGGILGAGEELIWPTLNNEIEDDGKSPPSIYRTVPTPQSHRNNLTALSNVHNLYFIGYQNRVYVYRLRSGPRARLPCDPDLQLRPKTTDEGKAIGGYVDDHYRGKGRTLNHLVTGFLGDSEILAMCTDNGDIFAYYTKAIDDYISSHEEAPLSDESTRNPNSRPQPFFSNNVCCTAWGLAIHQRSRLIAVSTNLSQVTVFAFGLTMGPPASDDGEELHEPKGDTEAWVRERRRNWKVVILLPSRASNVPNICFLDDDKGLAEKVAAVDINAVIWVADIWKAARPVLRLPPSRDTAFESQENLHSSSRGWGILGFRNCHFLQVDTIEQLLGLPLNQCDVKYPGFNNPPKNLDTLSRTVDISESLEMVHDNPCPPSNTSNRPTEQPGPFGAPVDVDLQDADLIDFEEEEEMLAWEGVLGSDDEEEDETILTQDDPGVLSSDEDQDQEDGDASPFLPTTTQHAGPPTNPWAIGVQPATQAPLQTGSLNSMENGSPPETAPVIPIGTLLNGVDAPFYQPLANLFSSIQTMNMEFEGLAATLAPGNASSTALNPLPTAAKLTVIPPTRTKRQPERKQPALSETELLDMVYYPHNGQVEPAPVDFLSRRRFRTSSLDHRKRAQVQQREDFPAGKVARGYHLLRCLEKDFEMLRLPEKKESSYHELGVVCSDALCCKQLRDARVGRFFRASSRISMLAHMPELNLVLLGSATGRVMLVTLTRLRSPILHQKTNKTQTWKWDHGMRVESVLPRLDEERLHRLEGSERPLFGVAAGLVQNAGNARRGAGAGSASLPRVYRVMLHYHNHLILTYEITRDEQTQKLCVF